MEDRGVSLLPSSKGVLLIGASPGLGPAPAQEGLRCGWHVLAMVPSPDLPSAPGP